MAYWPGVISSLLVQDSWNGYKMAARVEAELQVHISPDSHVHISPEDAGTVFLIKIKMSTGSIESFHYAQISYPRHLCRYDGAKVTLGVYKCPCPDTSKH